MKLIIYISIFFISTSTFAAKDTSRLVWPQEPDPAHIEYMSSLKKPSDIGIEKSFFAKLSDFVFGEEDLYLGAPFGVHVDGNRVYTTDIRAKKVYVFDKDENEVLSLEGSKKERFMYPVGVVTDSKGKIYVSDSVQAKIYVFQKDGDFDYIIENIRIKRPVGIAISPDDKRLYVVDPVSSQIHVLSLAGKFMFSIGSFGNKKGEFNKPTYMKVGKDGKIYVTDSMNHRIQILDKDGKYIHSFGHIGQKIGSFSNPRAIAIDSDENIYVSDTLFNVIQIFNSQGKLLLVFGNYGNRKGEFNLPINIAISKKNKIYISDTSNGRIQIFQRLDVAE